jgi:hypothetical protein
MYQNQPLERKSSGKGLFFIFLIAGLYFLNLAFSFVPIPSSLTANKFYGQALNILAGVLILLGGFRFLFPKRVGY